MGRLGFTVFVLVLMGAFSLPAYCDNAWPTTRFKVFAGNPFIGETHWAAGGRVSSDGFDLLEEEYPPGPDYLDPVAKQDIERAFTEAAQWYIKMGFPAPRLEPLVRDDEGLYYRIYVCKRYTGVMTSSYSNCGDDPPPATKSSGGYLPLCLGDTTRTYIMVMNPLKNLDGKKLNEVGYQTVAHELMHAIITNTKFGRQHHTCTVGFWITEGLPDAISFDLAENKWQGRYAPGNGNGALAKRYGYRPYSQRLPEGGRSVVAPGRSNPSDFKYTTSSFWRYVADSNNGWKGLLVNSKGNGLLDVTAPGLASDRSRAYWQSEVTWLDKGLYRKFNKNLNEIYGLFVNNFVFRIPPMEEFRVPPMEELRMKPAEETFPKWAEGLFGTCHVVNLSAATQQTITVQLRKLAARCIWVEPPGVQGTIQVSFQASSSDESPLKDIRIGRAGTFLDVSAKRATAPGNSSGFLGGWLGFQQDGAKRTLYVVSNVAEIPKDTKLRTITLNVSRTAITNNGITTGPMPPSRVAQPPMEPSYKKHARSFTQQRNATSKMMQEQMNLDKQSLNPNVDSAAKVTRRLNHPDCEQPFKYNVCGPHLSISLGLRPGTFILPGQTNTQGGAAAQAFAGLQAMSVTSLDAGADAKAIAEKLDSIDGNRVSIVIPLVDYGYSGSFTNAAISVGMSGGITLRAFGPPDEQYRTELLGRVTIEEYTPFIIRGTFSAPLAEYVDSVYTTRETISGSFTSVAPWQNDERVTFRLDSTQQMADDIANAMGLSAEMIQSMKEKGTMPGSSASGPATSSEASNKVVECTCECKMKPFADELCELLCEDEFAACDDP